MRMILFVFALLAATAHADTYDERAIAAHRAEEQAVQAKYGVLLERESEHFLNRVQNFARAHSGLTGGSYRVSKMDCSSMGRDQVMCLGYGAQSVDVSAVAVEVSTKISSCKVDFGDGEACELEASETFASCYDGANHRHAFRY